MRIKARLCSIVKTAGMDKKEGEEEEEEVRVFCEGGLVGDTCRPKYYSKGLHIPRIKWPGGRIEALSVRLA